MYVRTVTVRKKKRAVSIDTSGSGVEAGWTASAAAGDRDLAARVRSWLRSNARVLRTVKRWLVSPTRSRRCPGWSCVIRHSGTRQLRGIVAIERPGSGWSEGVAPEKRAGAGHHFDLERRCSRWWRTSQRSAEQVRHGRLALPRSTSPRTPLDADQFDSTLTGCRITKPTRTRRVPQPGVERSGGQYGRLLRYERSVVRGAWS